MTHVREQGMFTLHGCGGGTRTHDLRVMDPASCYLLHSASYCERATLLSRQLHLAANHPLTFVLLKQKRQICMPQNCLSAAKKHRKLLTCQSRLSQSLFTSLSHVAALGFHKRNKENIIAFSLFNPVLRITVSTTSLFETSAKL